MLSITCKPHLLIVIRLFAVMLNVIMLNVVMLNVIMLTAIMLNVAAPHGTGTGCVFHQEIKIIGLLNLFTFSNLFCPRQDSQFLACLFYYYYLFASVSGQEN